METRECPACGSQVDNTQQFCPMCGAKVDFAKRPKKQINKKMEARLFMINSDAEAVLAQSISWSISVYNKLFVIEEQYWQLIQEFPDESMAYCAYVDYAIKMVLKLNKLPPTSNYYLKKSQLDLYLSRCKNSLQKAKLFADDGNLEQILQLESTLSSQIESIANDDGLKKKQKINKIAVIVSSVVVGLIIVIGFICYLL